MIKRNAFSEIIKLLTGFPCVAIIGPRQVGKTTLVKQIRDSLTQESIYLDLELTSDYNKLIDAETFLSQNLSKTIIIDEIQRQKELFPILRALIDREKKPGNFIILGSASPDLIRHGSETLAGRIAYYELTPFIIPEISDIGSIENLWVKGGFPDAFLHDNLWLEWMNNFVRTYIDRDLPLLGFPADRVTSRRLWTMLAHHHGGLINYSDLSKSLEISVVTVKKYMNFVESAFLIYQLPSYYFNLKKRLVKAHKVYIRDSGILHFLLGLENINDIFGSPKMGASWEGFVIEQIKAVSPGNYSFYFYRTREGSELDLVIVKGGIPYIGIEIKFGSNVRPTKGNIYAIRNLKTRYNFIITKDDEIYKLSGGITICGIENFLKYYPNHIDELKKQ